MEFVDLISRWLHVGTAIVLLGGSVFTRFILHPAAAQLPEDAHQLLREGIVSRWKKFVHLGIFLLLATGFYNYLSATPAPAFKKQYHMLVGMKMLLAFALFAVASILVGRSARAMKWRANPRRALGIVLGLGIVIVAISGYLKVNGTKAWKIRALAEAPTVETLESFLNAPSRDEAKSLEETPAVGISAPTTATPE